MSNARNLANLLGTGTTVPSAKMPSGSVLQVKQAVITGTFSTSSTSFVDVTGLTVSITPSSSSNKILVIGNCQVIGGDAGGGYTILRGSTEIYRGDADGSRQRFSVTNTYARSDSANYYSGGASQAIFLDSPGTTSSTTYKIQAKIRATALYIGRTNYDLDNDNASRNPSSITVMEIAN